MNFENVLIEIKKLNPMCEIKLDSNTKLNSNTNVYFSVNPESLILPECATIYQNNGKYYLSGENLSTFCLLPLKYFPKNKRDYFPDIVFQNISFENIYELTKKNTTDLIIKYLKQISELDFYQIPGIGGASDFIKYICYAGLKTEDKFKGLQVDEDARNQLYKYITSLANTKVYKNPLNIQTGWESFQSWHISGGSAPDAKKTFTHRFYISISPDKIHELSQKLIMKYNEYGKPYYFKITRRGATKDSMVIYTSHGTLNTTLQIFRDLEPYIESISNKVATPHPLTYPLTFWLGYASEIMDGRTSYTDLMSEIIAIPLKDAINKFAKIHKNDIINGMAGKDFFGDTLFDEKLKRCQLVVKKIISNPNTLKELINNIYNYMHKKGIDFENIYYTDEVVTDLMNYREMVKKRNSSLNKGFVNLKLLVVPLIIILGVIIAMILR